MVDLNYRHLLYFATVARTGSVTAAARELGVSQPTVSEQIKRLEDDLGARLFRREGRALVLTDVGRNAYQYAERIFGLGRELVEAVTHHRSAHAPHVSVGVSDVVPKLIAMRLLRSITDLHPPVRLVCRQDRPERLLGQLGLGELDLVLADAPIRSGSPVRGFNRLLGESEMTCFAHPDLAGALGRAFPDALDGAPLLLPSTGTVLRASIERWLDERDLLPLVVAEFDDSAQLKAFGQAGTGAFFAPTVIADEISADYGVVPVGPAVGLSERFYAIVTERGSRHPAVASVFDGARALFGEST